MTVAKPRLGCLHMHHSNIPYIDAIVSPEQVEVVHFVEPGLMRRIGADSGFDAEQGERQVRRQLAWMAECEFDAILITCTNYIALLPDDALDFPIPVIKIDEPFFADVLEQEAPHALLFTNPATVEGTLRRLHDSARRSGREANVAVEVITGAFELVMAGKTEDYAEVVSARLRDLVRSGRYRSISVGQLSMAESARRVAGETGMRIGNPLDPLHGHLDGTLLRQSGG
jgi:hypothetical protein